jgi:phosphatidylglycerophosphatase A
MMDLILKYIATLGFIGYLPFAHGTFGSLSAVILFVFLKPSLSVHAILLSLIIPIGIISSQQAERVLNVKDSRHIVIDEFCGFFVSVFFIPFDAFNVIAAFFLFRFFDILKPFPIKKVESVLKGGIGIMADDIVAAIYTNVILQIWKLIY